MSIEENKRVAISFLKSLETVPDLSLMCEDGRWWIPGVGYLTREQIPGAAKRVDGVLKRPTPLFIDHVTAEDNRVAIEFRTKGELSTGAPYENIYHFLYIFRDGKILEQREHHDTAYAQRTIGPLLADAVSSLASDEGKG